MMKISLLLILGMALLTGALASEHGAEAPAHAKEEHSVFNGTVFEVKDLPTDFKLPAKLWDKVMATGSVGAKEAGGHGGGHDKKEEHGGDGGGGEREKQDTLIVWLPVEVSFIAKSPGILVHDSVQYNLPRGGGALDLSKITDGDKGTFYLKFGLNDFSSPSSMKVYFVSNSKKRRVDGEIFGAGCNVYFDVTSSFQKLNSGEGIKFNITNNRHVSALGGHFVFVQSDKDKVYLSQVEFKDSQNRDYLCKN